MTATAGTKRMAATMVCLLLAGLATPIFLAAGSGASVQTPAQLSVLISAGQGSAVYAKSVVDFAASHGLAVSQAKSLLSEGDTLLAAAQADALAGTDISGGIQSVQAAMKDYTAAAASASVAIGDAGLSVGFDVATVEQAITQVNASVAVVVSAAAAVCAQASGSSTGTATLAQACAQLDAQVASAALSLSQAASLSAAAQGQAGASADLSQAVALVGAARASLNSTQSALQAIASYGYVQRSDAYVNSVVVPLMAQANSTISAEGSVNASYAEFQHAYSSFTQAQASSEGQVAPGASALAGAIAAVDMGSVSSTASAAVSVASQVGSNLSALLGLPGITPLQGVVSDIEGCQSATTSFIADADAASSDASAYSQTKLSAFQAYAAATSQDASNVQTSGRAYVAAYQKVLSDLSALTSVPGVSAIYANLAGLQVSGNVNGITGSLSQAATATATVQGDITAFENVVAGQAPQITMPSSLLGAAASQTVAAQAYLNATGSAAMSQASSSVQALSQAASLFTAKANSSEGGTVGTFASSASGLAADGSALVAQATTSVRTTSTAGAYLGSDLGSRIADRLSAQAELSAAVRFFSGLDIADGVTAIAQASLELQAAASVGGQ
ncbi:MAG: hypothetical protein KGI26_02075 [Thaumarchaeota archaeon]|nr:hypothetical protein [Nitrososphaerota archaeon]